MNPTIDTTIIVFGLGVIFSILAYIYRQNDSRHRETQEALATQSKALERIVGKSEAYKDYPGKVTNLEIETARLKDLLVNLDRRQTEMSERHAADIQEIRNEIRHR